MLPCTKSYVSISILKKMLTCHVCDKRVQNPYSYAECDEHFFCFSCKGTGQICPVCNKSLEFSNLVKDTFLEDVLKTSCFTIHDKDFEREKVPLHVVKELCNEFKKIDKLHLNGKAINNLCTPVKVEKVNDTTSVKAVNSIQTKLNFSGKKDISFKLEDKNEGAKDIRKAGTIKESNRRLSKGNKVRTSSENSDDKNQSEKKISDLSTSIVGEKKPSLVKQDIKLEESEENENCRELDSQSIFVAKKAIKKDGVSKSSNSIKEISSKKSVKQNKSETSVDRKRSKPTSDSGPEKKKARQSADLNSSKILKDSNSKKGGKENFDKSILEKDKKTKTTFKKNPKGETALHIACRTNKINQLKELIATDLRLHLNEKDYAGWTPLHEAVTSKNYEIAKLLLEAGAWVFVPGFNFETPLHTALYRSEKLVELIMKYGPDIEAKTIHGQTPLSIAKELGLENLLINSMIEGNKVELPVPPASTPTIVYGHNLDANHKNLLSSMGKFGIAEVNNFSKEVSHIIVETKDDNTCESSITILEAILNGAFLVSVKWLEECEKAEKCLECEKFEVSGVGEHAGSCAPYKARLNAFRLLPGLFAGAFFYLVGTWRDSTKREQVISLINLGGGTLLKREPDPENIPASEITCMYHTKLDSVMGKCSHILLYNQENDSPQIKYRMNHIKTLPLKWLMNCIETFSIIDPE